MNSEAPLVVLILLFLSFSTAVASSTSSTAVSIPNSINPINPGSIPLGDGNLSTGPKAGSVYACQTSFNGGGAQTTGPWVNQTAKTWNSTAKISVEGNVSWPSASFSAQISGNQRIITGNDEPIDHGTGVFPISPSDPAYQYDRNPNHIAAHQFTLTLPANPTPSNVISCVPMGPIGVLTDGVFLYNALDALGRDAAAHEILDSCGGHPDSSSIYHHHEVPSCILDNATGPNTSTLVGYAIDGYGIYVERDSSGNLLTNANLDACHGRTSEVIWNGKLTMMYHYDATLEYPYTIGCLVGTPHPTQFTGPIDSSVSVTTSSSTTSSLSNMFTSNSTSSTSIFSSTTTTSSNSSIVTTSNSATSSTIVSSTSIIDTSNSNPTSTTSVSSSSSAQTKQGGSSSTSMSLIPVVVVIVLGAVLVASFVTRKKMPSGQI